MSLARSPYQPWTVDDFLDWCTRQDGHWELVDGFPAKMMAGATRRHDRIVVNILGELRNRLRGSPCEPFTADGAVQTRADRIRRPDVGIDCGDTGPNALRANEARVVFEVLSPSNSDFETSRKLAEYQDLASLRHIVFVSQNEPLLTHWFRDDIDPWAVETLQGLDTFIRLDAVGVELPLREIYDRVLD